MQSKITHRMKQSMSPELLEKKLNRPRPKRFNQPLKLSYSISWRSALTTLLSVVRSPWQHFRTLHHMDMLNNGALLRDPEYRERWSASLAEYAHWFYADKRLLHSVHWLGVPTRKMLTDLWVYQEIIHECRPDFVIEIGSLFGGSTLFIANICDMLGHGRVISIDISRVVYKINHPRVTEFTGDCAASEIVTQVQAMVGGGSVMVIHDADHAQSSVMRDLNNYAGLVTPGQYLIVEDGVVDLFNPQNSKLAEAYPDGGPMRASRRFLMEHADVFELDMTRERFLLTSNPQGFLRRRSALHASG